MEEKKRTYNKEHEVPIWERSLLTIKEAADYTGIAAYRLRMIAEKPNSNLIVWVGSKKMFKRKKLDDFIDNAISI